MHMKVWCSGKLLALRTSYSRCNVGQAHSPRHAISVQVKDAAGSVKSAAGSAGEKAKDLVGQGCADF